MSTMVGNIQLSKKISSYLSQEPSQAVLLLSILEQRLGFRMFYFMKNDHKIIIKCRCLEVL